MKSYEIDLAFEDIVSNIRTLCIAHDHHKFNTIGPMRGWRRLWVGWPYEEELYVKNTFGRVERIVKYVFTEYDNTA